MKLRLYPDIKLRIPIEMFLGGSHIKSKSIDTIDIKNRDVISFKEWSFKGERFYENLLEGNRDEVLLFKKYRDDILME